MSTDDFFDDIQSSFSKTREKMCQSGTSVFDPVSSSFTGRISFLFTRVP